ncbi:hypothetical protein F4861DRAFT_541928 [Xylaria intraflava]|nr:hypothetical protein F4861DRAFT_541928 [Xylaria intraflava]
MKSSSKKGPSIKGPTSEPRGAKRKAKHDPYEELHATDDGDDDDDEVIPAVITPASQRTAGSRMSSATPGLVTKTRPLPVAKRGIARPVVKSNRDDASSMSAATVTVATASPSRTDRKEVVAPQRHANTSRRNRQDSVVPKVNRQDSVPSHNAISAVSAPAASVPKPAPEAVAEPSPQEKNKAKQPDTKLAPAERKAEDADEREEKEVVKILQHRMAGDQSGAVELLVQWVGEGEDEATWEAENEIQQGADEILYEYWKTQGGRINALFHKPRHPPSETYHVFKVLRHERNNRGGFQFEVQWVGHPSTRGETSMETETKLKNIAPKLLAAYWDSVGGRTSFLAPRGRVKKTRTG